MSLALRIFIVWIIPFTIKALPLSLDDVRALALQHHPQLKERAIEKKQLDLKGALAYEAFHPKVDLLTSVEQQKYQSEVTALRNNYFLSFQPSLSLNTPVGTQIGIGASLRQGKGYLANLSEGSLELSVKQPLLRGASLLENCKAIDDYHDELLIQQYQNKLQTIEIIEQVSNQYRTIQALTFQLEQNNQQLNILEAQREAVALNTNIGRSSQSELLNWDIYLQQNRLELARLQAQMKFEKQALKKYIGYDTLKTLELDASLGVKVTLESLDYYLEKGFENNPNLSIYQQERTRLERHFVIAKKQRKSDLSLEAQLSIGKKSNPLVLDELAEHLVSPYEAAAIVRLSYHLPVGHNRYKNNTLSNIRYQLDKLDLAYSTEYENLKHLITQAHQSLDMALEQSRIGERLLGQTKQQVKNMAKKYELGRCSFNELKEAKVASANAFSHLLQLQLSASIAQAQLERLSYAA